MNAGCSVSEMLMPLACFTRGLQETPVPNLCCQDVCREWSRAPTWRQCGVWGRKRGRWIYWEQECPCSVRCYVLGRCQRHLSSVHRGHLCSLISASLARVCLTWPLSWPFCTWLLHPLGKASNGNCFVPAVCSSDFSLTVKAMSMHLTHEERNVSSMLLGSLRLGGGN